MKADVEMVVRLINRSDGRLDVQDIEALIRASRALHRLNETRCNRNLTEQEERRYGRLESKVKEIALANKVLVYFQGDPRGCALWVLTVSDIKPGETIHAVYDRGVAVY